MSCCSEKSEEKRENDTKRVEWIVRPMRFEDINRCLEIWQEVELCEARETVATALAIDPEGLYVAELKPSGELVGMCSGVFDCSDSIFMGFYAVTPEYQGLGIGRQLWAQTTARIQSSINVGLYGVPSMSHKYKKSGFKVEDEIRMLIFESEPDQQLPTGQLECLESLRSKLESSFEIELLANRELCNSEMIDKLIDYDAQVLGHSRHKLLRHYLLDADEVPLTVALVQRSPSKVFEDIGKIDAISEETKRESFGSATSSKENDNEGDLSVNVRSSLSITETTEGNDTQPALLESSLEKIDGSCSDLANQATQFLGYGCLRYDNTGGAMVGPLYANSSAACEVILRALIERCDMKPGGKYSILTLTSNEPADKMLRKIGLKEMDQCTRMFTNNIPKAPGLDRIYFIHSPNFSSF